MPIESKMTKGKLTCQITGDMRIWTAAEIWKDIQPMIGGDKPLVFDLKAVTACDAAGVQILCQLLRAAKDRQYKIAFMGASDAIQSAMQLAGFDDDTIKAVRGDA